MPVTQEKSEISVISYNSNLKSDNPSVNAREIANFLAGLEATQSRELALEKDHIQFLEKTLISLKNNVKVLRSIRNGNIRSDSRSVSRRNYATRYD